MLEQDWFDDENDDEPKTNVDKDFLTPPGSREGDPPDLRASYAEALESARKALKPRHFKAVAFNGDNGNHRKCATKTHDSLPCPCCPQCGITAIAMLRDRRGRRQFASMSWLDYYRAIAVDPGQCAAQWVEGGEDRLAPRLGLPANPRQAIAGSTKLREMLALRLDVARVDDIVACLAVAAELARRRAFDGDPGSLPLRGVATALTKRGLPTPGRTWAPDEVRQALHDAAAAVADAWIELPSRSKAAWRLLRRLVFCHLHGDDSVDRIVAAAGREPENVLADAGQPSETRTGGGVDVADRAAERVCPRLARRDTASLSPEQRVAAIRRLVLADFKAEDDWRTLEPGPVAAAQRAQDVEDAITLVALTFADAEFDAELQRRPGLSAVQRHELRKRCYAAWGIRLADT